MKNSQAVDLKKHSSKVAVLITLPEQKKSRENEDLGVAIQELIERLRAAAPLNSD